MRDKTRMVLLIAGMGLLILTAGGCTMNAQSRGELPFHQLDLAAQPAPRTATIDPAPAPRVSRPPRIHGDAAWANTHGYRPWRYIVVHHSATDGGNAAAFDAAHRRRGWDELGYHFVIDNGDGGPDGRVEVGTRWSSQKWGAHCKTPDNEYNNYGIGICLVGDFNQSRPTAAQLASLRRLVRYLAARHDIPAGRVIGHQDAPGTSTECPGRFLHSYVFGELRAAVADRLAASD